MKKRKIWRHTFEKLSKQTPEVQKYGPPRAPGNWTLNTGSLVWNWLYVTLLAHRIFWWLSDIWTTCALLLPTLAKKMAAMKFSQNSTKVKGPQISWHVIVCFMTCNCARARVCVCHSQHTVSSKVWMQCNFCSQDYVSVLLQMYLHMRGCTCYELRYSIIMQLYLIPGNMQQSPCTEATSVSATQ
jgi:hypothetical protein